MAVQKITFLHAADGGGILHRQRCTCPGAPSPLHLYPVVIVPSNSLRLGALLACGLALTLAACDTSTPVEQQADDGTLVQTARSWFDANTAALGKTGTDDEALRRFFPDWAGGAVVEGPGGDRAVVTRLWRDATVRYDSSLYFLRVLAVVVNDSGAVTRGRIVEFVSGDSLGDADGPALVRSWMGGGFGARRVGVAEHTAGYEFVRARYFTPERPPLDLVPREEECVVAGKAMARVERCTRYYYEDGGWDPKYGYDVVVSYSSWTCVCIEGCDGGGSGGSTGGTSGGGGSTGGTGDPGYNDPFAQWQSTLNPTELAICFRNLTQCRVAWSAKNEAEARQGQHCNPNGGPADAYRHAFWAALMTYEINGAYAKELTDAHELGLDSDKERDLHNNAIGIRIGNEVRLVFPYLGSPSYASRQNAMSLINGKVNQAISSLELRYMLPCSGGLDRSP